MTGFVAIGVPADAKRVNLGLLTRSGSSQLQRRFQLPEAELQGGLEAPLLCISVRSGEIGSGRPFSSRRALCRPGSRRLGTAGRSGLGAHHPECLPDDRSQLLIVHPGELDTHPPRNADIRRAEVGLRILLDECRLRSRSRRHPHGDMAIAMVVVGEHRKHPLGREKRRLSVRYLFDCTGNGLADASHSLKLRAIVFLGCSHTLILTPG